MRRLLFICLLFIPMHANAIKVFYTEWDAKYWTENKFCAIGAFEDRSEVRVELCAENLGAQVKSLWFYVGSGSFLTPLEALSGLPDLLVENAIISKEPCGAAVAMISGQPLKKPVSVCYTVLIPTQNDPRKFVTIEFEDQQFVSAHAPAFEGLGR